MMGKHTGGDISIHALREEGDLSHLTHFGSFRLFLSTPSARRATVQFLFAHASGRFLSTPSVRRTTPSKTEHTADVVISIHALREEGDHPRGW